MVTNTNVNKSGGVIIAAIIIMIINAYERYCFKISASINLFWHKEASANRMTEASLFTCLITIS